MEQSTKLFNRNFLLISLASFLMFFAFNLVMPVIAMYVMDRFNASATTAGIVVSSYIITALISRPFSGYLVDKYNRKKLYVLTFSIFTFLFLGYIYSTSIPMLIATRILLGSTFAILTTASNTIAIDVLPAQKRAEGIGYFGALVVISMAVGPMVGLYLMDIMSYMGLFTVALGSCVVGTIVGSQVKTPHRPSVIAPSRMSFDRFFLVDGLSMASIMTLIYFLYGSLMAYVSIYVKECGLDINSGQFFLLFSIGIIIARVVSGRYLSRGLHNLLVFVGLICIFVAGGVFALLLTELTFPISSLIIGFGFGLVAPPVQAMIVDLVPHNRRGTANSTYFIALDFGSGMGMLTGGMIAHAGDGFSTTYMVGLGFVAVAVLLFNLFSRSDYARRLKRAKANMVE
ncbi:MAG: MFS transporter [Rikenellaceae bacterium]